MLSHSSFTSGSIGGDRIFIYEVEGLRQTDQVAQDSHVIRQSGTTLIQVPLHRMGDFMARMNRLGSKIVAIRISGSTNAGESQSVNSQHHAKSTE
jgi:phycocyanin-associated, rod